MRILVTGGAGFIGSHLVWRLVEQGNEVRILDALVPQVHGTNATWPTSLPSGLQLIKGDVTRVDDWKQALADTDVVYHFAAEVGVGQSMYEITRYINANTVGTSILLELLASRAYHVKRVIVASSMSVYGEGAYRCAEHGNVSPLPRPASQMEKRHWEILCEECGRELIARPTPEEKPLQPKSVYAVSKRDQEELCLIVGQAYRIPTVALRFFNVYGPGQALSNPYTGVAAIFSARLLNRKPPLIFEDGQQSRDFVHVEDVVQALVLAMDAPLADYKAINIGSGCPRKVIDIAYSLADALGIEQEPCVENRFRAGDIRHCFADITKAQTLLGYKPSVDFAAGIRELANWVREQTADDALEQSRNALYARGLAF